MCECGDIAWQKMADDVKAGNCRNNLYIYKDAERIILDKWLLDEIPASIWAKMTYASKIKNAKEKGLLDRFDESLREASQARFNRPCEFPSKNDLKNQNTKQIVGSIASHWRT